MVSFKKLVKVSVPPPSLRRPTPIPAILPPPFYNILDHPFWGRSRTKFTPPLPLKKEKRQGERVPNYANWNDHNWPPKICGHNKSQNPIRKNLGCRFFRQIYLMVSVIALWTNIRSRDKEPALCGVLRCTTCFI